MNFVLNVVWIISGGLEMAVGWLVASFFFAISIVGLPWARGAFNLRFFICGRLVGKSSTATI